MLSKEPGKSQHEWEKTINRSQYWHESDVEIVRLLQQAIRNSLEANEKKKTKTENLNKEIEVTKKSQMEVIELKNSYQNKKLTGSAQQ